MIVGEICNRAVATASPRTSVVAAAQRMQALEERVLVVIAGSANVRAPLGIVTERELAAVIAREGDPGRLQCRDIMRADAGFVTDTADAYATVCWMHRNGLREAIVHDAGGGLAGVLTLDQLVETLVGEMIAASARGETAAAGGPHTLH